MYVARAQVLGLVHQAGQHQQREEHDDDRQVRDAVQRG
jgi:hypothetical protein